LIPLTIPVINKEMKKIAIQTLQNELLVGGESVNKFEDLFAKYIGSDYAVSTNSGSSALLLVFGAINIKKDDKVAAPSATFIATTNGACLLGAKPLFCEIGDDYVISPQQLEVILSKNIVKCAIPVHLYGHPCDMSTLQDIAKKRNVTLIEDAAQAHGAEHKKIKAGNLAEAAIFSFYPTKNLTVGGDGGMITTNNKKIYEFAIKMRDVGRKTKYTHDKIGYTLRLNSVNAGIGLVQLRYLDMWNEKRRKIAATYRKKLKDLGDLILPPDDKKNSKSVYHVYVIRTKKRNLLKAWLSKNGVATGVHYPIPVHRQPAYRQFVKDNSRLSFTDEWSKTVLSIPMHPNLGTHDQKLVINLVTRFYEEKLYDTKELHDVERKFSADLI
jgi:dTDP-4-amino-4,6-dideoxygalactose transaminase